MSAKQWQKIEAIYRKATRCDECFRKRIAEPSEDIKMAQPRWIGSEYFNAHCKILLVMLNPGTGKRKQSQHDEYRPRLNAFRNGRTTLRSFLESQNPLKWGRFKEFYIDGMGLVLDNIALTNIALCPDKNNKHPRKMLEKCFDKHTRELIKTLHPGIVILSGSGTHNFSEKIKSLIACETVPTIHYAHREGKMRENSELKRAKKKLQNI